MIKTVIFDLDGTLADTAGITTARREPWHILSPGFPDGPDWRMSPAVSDLPGQLITRGYQVVIATRAPMAYASTLTHLTGVDTQLIIASCGPGLRKAHKIGEVLRAQGLRPDEVLYVGDLAGDADIAAVAGVRFADVDAVLSGQLLSSLPAIRSLRPRLSSQLPVDPPFAFGEYDTPSGPVDAAEIAKAVALSIRLGIPDDDAHRRLLETLFQHPSLTPVDRSALCYFSLEHHPGSSIRRFLQEGLLIGLQPSNDRCIIMRTPTPSLFQVRPNLLTKFELRSDSDLHRRYLQGLARVFTPLVGKMTLGEVDVPIRVAQTYRAGFGNILGETKHYRGAWGTRWRSGPEVMLGHLDLVADVVAASMSDFSGIPLVAVPPTPATATQPGELSLRLAHAVAQRVGASVLPALTRTRDVMKSDRSIPPAEVVLLDDQITLGYSIRHASRHLIDAGFGIRAVVAYSAKERFLSEVGVSLLPSTQICGFAPVAKWLGTPCRCGRRLQ